MIILDPLDIPDIGLAPISGLPVELDHTRLLTPWSEGGSVSIDHQMPYTNVMGEMGGGGGGGPGKTRSLKGCFLRGIPILWISLNFSLFL